MRLVLFAPPLFALLLGVACVATEPSTQDIVSTIPWPGHERAEYVLLDRDGQQERGQGVLTIMRQDGTYSLALHFENEEATDESAVVVDATTLKPISTRRELVGAEDVVIAGAYDPVENVVRITETKDGGEPRTVPRRLKDHYYDNDSSLFLWRTVPFEEGYKANYRTVLTNQGSQRVVSLRVVGKEDVTVPAGTFTAWRIEIHTADIRQIAWYADTPERPLVQYDSSIQLFQLTSIE